MASSSGSSSTATTTSDIEHHTIRFFQGARPDAAANYELLSHLGRGAYGEVWAAKDPDDHSAAGGGKVAIKKINNAFCQATEAKRILRELRILRHLDHPNIIKIREVLRPQSESAFSDLWVVFDFVDLDLRKLIASPQTITVPHVQWICHQMLVGLQYLHSAHVLHRDLKPANVLLSERCEVKLCDFGLARVVDESDWALNEQRERAAPALARRCSSENPLERKPPPQISRQMTSHVVTRWYRAPELILLQRYTAAIDVWSFACIFAELLTMLPEARVDRRDRGALFPGRSCLPLSPVEDDANPEPNLDQLNVIFSVLGTPQGPLGWIELPEMRDYLHSLSPLPPTPLAELYPAAPAAALELLEAMLRFEPFKRLTVEQALEHRFFESMTYRLDTKIAVRPVDAATIDFEHAEVQTAAIRKLVLAEIAHYTAVNAAARGGAEAARAEPRWAGNDLEGGDAGGSEAAAEEAEGSGSGGGGGGAGSGGGANGGDSGGSDGGDSGGVNGGAGVNGGGDGSTPSKCGEAEAEAEAEAMLPAPKRRRLAGGEAAADGGGGTD